MCSCHSLRDTPKHTPWDGDICCKVKKGLKCYSFFFYVHEICANDKNSWYNWSKFIAFQESNFVAYHLYFNWHLESLSPSNLGALPWFVPLHCPYTISQGQTSLHLVLKDQSILLPNCQTPKLVPACSLLPDGPHVWLLAFCKEVWRVQRNHIIFTFKWNKSNSRSSEW